jgi:hypothetical protein
MAEYRVIYWKHIPTVVLAREGGEQARCALPPRFQAAVDAQAMADGSVSDQAYSAAWRKTAWASRDGPPDDVAKSVAAELEAAFDTRDKLFVAALDYLLERFRAGSSRALSAVAEPDDRLRAWLDHQRGLLQSDRGSLEVYYDYWNQGTRREPVRDKLNQMYTAWRQEISGLLSDTAAPGHLPADEAAALPAAVMALVQGAALQLIMNPEALDVEAYFRLVRRLVDQAGNGVP